MRSTSTSALPNFVVDWESIVRTTGRQIDWANVPEKYRSGAFAVTLTANAAADATALAVAATDKAIPTGTVLDYGGKKFARTTAPSVAGATSLTVAALATALVTGDTAYTGGTTEKSLPAGTAMAETTPGQLVPRTGDDAAVGLLISDASEGVPSDAKSGYGFIVGGSVFEQLLPDYAASGAAGAAWTAIKTELGPRFFFQYFGDSRG